MVAGTRLRTARGAAVAAGMVLACFAVACGSDDDDGDGGSGGGGAEGADSAVLADAKAALERGYEGDFEPPPTEGPKAVPGKKVWMISCGQAFEACVQQSNSFKEAGEELGWDVTIQDGKADPTVAAGIIRQAVAGNVDGVAVGFFDCPGVKSALVEARKAEVPVVTFGSLDCDNPVYGGNDEPLYTAVENVRGSTDIAEFYAKWATARAQYTIATSDGKANVLGIYENSQAIQQANGDAYAEQLEKCTTCELTRVPFSFAQVPNPATQQWKSAILSHPKADVVANGIDALMALGLQSAVAAAGRPITVEGAELNPSNIGLIRDGVQKSATAVPYGWIYWGLADTLNRVFAGDDPGSFPSQGAGWQFVDKEHNLPSGDVYDPPVDYRAAYKKIWAGQ